MNILITIGIAISFYLLIDVLIDYKLTKKMYKDLIDELKKKQK